MSETLPVLTPRKRVPLEIPAEDQADPNMPKELWQDLHSTIIQEARHYSTTKTLSALPSPGPKTKDTPSTSPPRRRDHLQPICQSSRRYVLGLSRLFGALGDAGIGPHAHRGLNYLHCAAQAATGTVIYWSIETELQKKIRLKQEELLKENEMRIQIQAARLAEQRQDERVTPQKSSAKITGEELYREAQTNFENEVLRDKHNLEMIDRRAAHEERERELAAQRQAEHLAQRKAEIKAQRDARAKERQMMLEKLREDEEENRDTQDAVTRVRSKWEVAKKKADSDPTVLDNY